MHKTGIALGLILAAGAAVTLPPWYSGTQLEGTLQAALERGNQQLREALPGQGASLELVALERGIFSSTARYRIAFGEAEGADGDPAELLFSDRIEHGPLPLSRLASFELAPVLAVSRFSLERSAAVTPWFAGAGGAVPLSGYLVLGYDDSVTGQVSLHPLELASDQGRLRFSGIDLALTLGAQAQTVQLSGGMDSLTFDFPRDGEVAQVRLSGLSLNSEHRLGASGFYVGGSRLALARVELLDADRPGLLVENFVQTDRIEEQGSRLSAALDYEVGSLGYGGRPLGSASLGLTLGNLDVAALQRLESWYKELLARMNEPQAQPVALTDSDERRLRDGLEALLAGKPSVSLDRLALRTASGESRFDLRVELDRPQSYELPPAELARQLIGRLEAHLVLGKPTIRDLMNFQASLDPDTDQGAAALQAEEVAELAAMIATSMQVGRVEGEDIVSRLSYAGGQVDFNGQAMPAEEFVAMLAGMAPGSPLELMPGVVDGKGELAGLEEEADEGYDLESVSEGGAPGGE